MNINNFFLNRATFLFICMLTSNTASANEYNNIAVISPDGAIKVDVVVGKNVTYKVTLDDQILLEPSRLSLQINNNKDLLHSPKVLDVHYKSVNNTLKPVIAVKSSIIEEKFNEIIIDFDNDFSVAFRAYNNGVAYRYITSFANEITVNSELVEYQFNESGSAYLPIEEGFYSHNERTYIYKNLDKVMPKDLASLPALVTTSSVKVLITESSLEDYPGLWLTGDEESSFKGAFAKFPLDTEMETNSDRNEPITKRANYIAKTQGTRSFPWRILGIAKNDGDLITNQLSYLLAAPKRIEDTSWVKTGKVAWDWYNANNIYGVDFKSGINTETYKYYIDFAAENGIEYVILDEGWYPLGDLLATAENMDIEELVAYGKKKDVELILWVVWKTLDLQLEQAMNRFEKLGVAGIKVDFMQRDDQGMVNYYWKVAKEAAKRKLLVNFHGSYKPSGLRRTYPNVISREGVKGLEWNKWSKESTPEHNVTLPFIRMVAGPMDYTPGAMMNAQKKNFHVSFDRPMSMTTRVHQMAMFTVFESPLQMLADTPSNYMKEQECTTFIARVPSVWDETVVLKASVGDFIVLARRKANKWFIGAMTDEHSREFSLDLSFLKHGKYKLDSFADGINADKWASDYKHTTRDVQSKDKIIIKLAPAGGWTASLTAY